jgi:hypothetical protein
MRCIQPAQRAKVAGAAEKRRMMPNLAALRAKKIQSDERANPIAPHVRTRVMASMWFSCNIVDEREESM